MGWFSKVKEKLNNVGSSSDETMVSGSIGPEGEVQTVLISKKVNWFSVKSKDHITHLLQNSFNHYGKIRPSVSFNLFEEAKGVDEVICDMDQNECWSKRADAKGQHDLSFKINEEAAYYLQRSFDKQPPAREGHGGGVGGWIEGFTPNISKIEHSSEKVLMPIKFCKSYGCDQAAWDAYKKAKREGKVF